MSRRASMDGPHDDGCPCPYCVRERSAHHYDPLSDCPCFRCLRLDMLLWGEAVASVALDRDPLGQTISLDEIE